MRDDFELIIAKQEICQKKNRVRCRSAGAVTGRAPEEQRGLE